MTQSNQTMAKSSMTLSHRDNYKGLKTASKYNTQSPTTTNRGSIVAGTTSNPKNQNQLQQSCQSPKQKFKQNIDNTQTTLRVVSGSVQGNPIHLLNQHPLLNLNPASTEQATIGGKVVV